MEEEAEVAVKRRRRPTPDHPPYSEMVQCAIRDLAEKQGSTEPAISAYIRSHYDSLPWAHSKLLPYYLHKLLLAGEISKSSSSPNRYILPKPLNPSPSPSPQPNGSGPRKRGGPKNPFVKPFPPRPLVKRGRGRPRKIKFPEAEPNSSCPVLTKPMSMLKLDSGEQRPRLILKLKRSRSVDAGGYWHFLREEVQEKDLNGVDVDGHNEELNGEKIEEHDENLLASQEEDLNGIAINEHHVESWASQEQEDFDRITIDEHGGETLASQEKYLNGIGSDGHNGEMLALKENGLNSIATDGQKGCDGIMIDEHRRETLGSQEKDLNGIGKDNELDGIEIDGHNEELLGLQVVPDAESCKPRSDQGTPCMKAKPKKSRKLWYEG